MTAKQRVMLFRMLHRAAAAMGRDADDELRRELTAQALGSRKSWTKLTNGEVDRIKALLQTVSGLGTGGALPLNLPGEQERARLIKGIERFLPAPGGDGTFFAEYVETVSMAKFDTRDWRALTLAQTRQLHYTIKARARQRGARG